MSNPTPEAMEPKFGGITGLYSFLEYLINKETKMNLKQKLEQNITQKKADSDLLSQISTLKSKLASQKSFNSAGYNKLSEIEHSLYRYNTFITGNLTKEADCEAQRLSGMVKNLNDENIVLEGGITNSKYIWHTEPNACKTCQELDGTVYYTKEDIPEKPHPNCKCSVEEVPMDKETCDCLEALDTMIIDLENTVSNAEILTYKLEQENEDIEQDISKVEKMIAEAYSDLHFLEGEYGKHLPDCENNIDNQYGEIYATKAELQTLLNDLLGLLNPVATILNVVRVFVTNYLELLHEAYVLKQTGMDKYRHSKANCEAAQYGILGS